MRGFSNAEMPCAFFFGAHKMGKFHGEPPGARAIIPSLTQAST